jgi:hypothetical protein
VNNPDLERRAVLRGMLAAGCAAMVPILSGCEKAPPKVADAPAEAPPTAPMAAEPSPSAPSDGKISKQEATYQEQPKGDQKCSGCQHFVAESSTCKVVEGTVSPNGWCKLWVALAPSTPAS